MKITKIIIAIIILISLFSCKENEIQFSETYSIKGLTAKKITLNGYIVCSGEVDQDNFYVRITDNNFNMQFNVDQTTDLLSKINETESLIKNYFDKRSILNVLSYKFEGGTLTYSHGKYIIYSLADKNNNCIYFNNFSNLKEFLINAKNVVDTNLKLSIRKP